MSAAIALWLAIATTSGGVQIRSDVDCPSAPDVAARLQRLVGDDAATSATLSIERRVDTLTLTLTDVSGSVVDARTWPTSDDCAATAEAFAVVTAAWLGDLPPVRTTLAAPARASNETTIEKPAAPPPRSALLTVVLNGGASAPMASPSPSGVQDHWTTPAIGLDVLVRPSASSTGFAGVAFFANLPRDWATGDWYRLDAGPEAGFTNGSGRFRVMASGGVMAGALVGYDGGYPPASVYFDVAAFADLRAGLAFGSAQAPWDLWLSLHGRGFLRTLSTEFLEDERLPNRYFEAALMLGGDYSWRL